jgi:hypothetical protein
MVSIIRKIYEEKGLIGFYRGYIPNLVRVSIKQIYRWPMMIFFPRFFKKHFGENAVFNKILTGLVIANIEIFIICPLDRLKVFFMTSQKANNVFKYFISVNRNKLLTELFAGLGPTYWRSNISWVSFLYLDQRCKDFARYYRKDDNLGFIDLIIVSMVVCFGNLLTSKTFLL